MPALTDAQREDNRRETQLFAKQILATAAVFAVFSFIAGIILVLISGVAFNWGTAFIVGVIVFFLLSLVSVAGFFMKYG